MGKVKDKILKLPLVEVAKYQFPMGKVRKIKVILVKAHAVSINSQWER